MGEKKPDRLLALFKERVGKTVPYHELLTAGWGRRATTRPAMVTLRMTVSSLRRETGANIVNVKDEGYRMEAEA